MTVVFDEMKGKFFNKKSMVFEKYHQEKSYISETIISEILSLGVPEIIDEIIKDGEPILSARDFPLMSELYDATTNIVEVLDCVESGMHFVEIGRILRTKTGNDMANYKYGESHSKVAELLGLVKIDSSFRPKTVNLSYVGYYYLANRNNRDKLLTRLLLFTPVIRTIICKSNKECFEVSSLMNMFTPKTVNRRLSSTKILFNKLVQSDEYCFKKIYDNAKFTLMEI